ncbi:hypothetical protein Tco_0388009 [Tanacetum coccineum]
MVKQIIRYCKSKPNVKVLAKSILKGPYQYKKVLKPSDDTVTLLVLETYRLQNETELNETEQKQAEADDQAINIFLLGLPVDVYAILDSCLIANEMWNRIIRLHDTADCNTEVLQSSYVKYLIVAV